MWEGSSPDTPWMVLLYCEHLGNLSKHSCPTPGCPACVSRLTLSSTGSPCPRHVASPAPALLAPLPMPVQWKQPYSPPRPPGKPRACPVVWFPGGELLPPRGSICKNMGPSPTPFPRTVGSSPHCVPSPNVLDTEYGEAKWDPRLFISVTHASGRLFPRSRPPSEKKGLQGRTPVSGSWSLPPFCSI